MELKLFDEIEKRFENHLNLEGNNRIILSGKFGSGKTTFLNYFFSENKSYEVFYLFPVNYSVGSNEDIATYIKYDIIQNIFNKKLIIENFDFTYFDTLPLISKKELLKIVVAIIENIVDVKSLEAAKPLFGIAKSLNTLIKSHHEKISSEVNQLDQLNNYISSVENNPNSIYFNDQIATFITAILQANKNKNRIENILVIDDLDRIDPAHIFRILNIFSAHSNFTNLIDKNDYGFDKIILVCDVDNIRNIYSTFYGVHTDFNGYIDKFYSKSIFDFYYSNSLKRYFEKLFRQQYEGSNSDIIRNRIFDYGFMQEIFLLFINNGFLNIRLVSKLENHQMYFTDTTYEIAKGLYVTNREFPILFHLKMCMSFFGRNDFLFLVQRINYLPQSVEKFMADLIYLKEIRLSRSKIFTDKHISYTYADYTVTAIASADEKDIQVKDLKFNNQQSSTSTFQFYFFKTLIEETIRNTDEVNPSYEL